MTTTTELFPPTSSTPTPPPDTVADLLYRLGDIPPSRIRMDPPPGRVTFDDLVRVNEEHIGQVSAPDGVMKILPGIGRAPDVSFISWKTLPGGKPPPPSEKVPAVVPDLVVEVLSTSNTPREMARKRGEYFRAGVKLVWEIDPELRSANVFTGPSTVTPVPANGTLDGGDILPEFTLSLREVFDRAERR
jgi:Uma2 family endonuclease